MNLKPIFDFTLRYGEYMTGFAFALSVAALSFMVYDAFRRARRKPAEPKKPTIADELRQISNDNFGKLRAVREARLKDVNAYAGKILAECRLLATEGYTSHMHTIPGEFSGDADYIARDLRKKGLAVRVRSHRRDVLMLEW